MTNQHDAATVQERPIVYIRRVAVADLPDDIREQAKGIETLYAIGSETGEQLALVKDRKMAFAVARQNDMTPLSVH
jgi:hypothetical protein